MTATEFICEQKTFETIDCDGNSGSCHEFVLESSVVKSTQKSHLGKSKDIVPKHSLVKSESHPYE